MKENVELYKTIKQFYEISGFRVSIHDNEFNEIYAYPSENSAFCKAIQKNRSELEKCRKTDSKAFSKAQETGKPFIYTCRYGLCEAVAPIYHYGSLSGYLMIGQVSTLEVNAPETFKKYLLSVSENDASATLIAKTIKTIPRDKIESYLGIMTVIAEYITETNRLQPRNQNLAQLVAEYINKNYTSKITLDILMCKFRCCKSTITKAFRAEYKMSVLNYLTQVRLNKAIELMQTGEMSLKEISRECGFSDQNYFSRVFFAAYKLSPTDYKRNLKL